MKLITALISIIMLTNCGSSNKMDSQYSLEENPPFTVGSASYQQWIAGTPEGGRGVNVIINLSDVKEGVVIEDIYFQNKKVTATTSPNIRTQYLGYFKNKPKQDIVMDSDPIQEAANTPPAKIPFELDSDDAVIGYTFKEKSHFFKVKNLERKELLAYPATNPNGDN